MQVRRAFLLLCSCPSPDYADHAAESIIQISGVWRSSVSRADISERLQEAVQQLQEMVNINLPAFYALCRQWDAEEARTKPPGGKWRESSPGVSIGLACPNVEWYMREFKKDFELTQPQEGLLCA